MASNINNAVLDAYLNDIVDNCDKMFLCDAAIDADGGSAWTAASSTNMLATQTLTPGDTNSYTISNEGTGRKFVVAEQSITAATNAGDATHVALGDSGASAIKLVFAITTTAIAAGQPVTVGAMTFTAAQPA